MKNNACWQESATNSHLYLLIVCASAYFLFYYLLANSFVYKDLSIHTNAQYVMRIFSLGQEHKTRTDHPCLASSKKKPKTGFYIRNLDSLIYKKTDPKYPEKAKEKRITGTVIVDVVVNTSGEVEWAKMSRGHKLLQDAVREVVCQVKFKPTNDINHHIKAGGSLTFKFE
jgi:TonB family protein